MENEELRDFVLNYRDEFSITLKAKNKNEAISLANKNKGHIECIGDLWEEFFTIEEEGIDFEIEKGVNNA